MSSEEPVAPCTVGVSYTQVEKHEVDPVDVEYIYSDQGARGNNKGRGFSRDTVHRDRGEQRRGPRNGEGTTRDQLKELRQKVAAQEEAIRRLGAVFGMLSSLQDHGTGDVCSLAGGMEGMSLDEHTYNRNVHNGPTGANRTPLGQRFSSRHPNHARNGGNGVGRGGRGGARFRE